MEAGIAKLDDLQKLRRFFFLGNGNCLYHVKIGSNDYFNPGPVDSAHIVTELLTADRGEEVVDEIVRFVSSSTCATNHTPAIFALAMCARHSDKSFKTKQAAMKALTTVCNTSAELFQFIAFSQKLVESKKGWGRALKTGVQGWFDSRDSKTLAKIVTKQKTGSKWSFVDLLRVTHIKPKTEGAKMIAKYIIRGLKAAQEEFGGEKANEEMQAALTYLAAVEQLKTELDDAVAVGLIEQHKLHPQQVVSSLQQYPEVLAALVKQLSLKEIIENIGQLARRALLEPDQPASADLIQRIGDEQEIKQQKLSPLAVLIAMRVYEQGAAALKWTRNCSVVEALNTAFIFALKHNVVSTNKRYLLAVNINSQFLRCWVHGAKVLSPIIAAAGIAMVLAHTEKDPVLAFLGKEVKLLSLTTTMQMPEICEEIARCTVLPENNRCGCDVSAPITWALQSKTAFDVIIVLTDFRHARASIDVSTALKQYRNSLNLPHTKFVVSSLTSNNVHFADRDDAGMLDVGGFDATVPDVIHKFVTGVL